MSDSLDRRMAELKIRVQATRRDLDDLRRRVRAPIHRCGLDDERESANDRAMGQRTKAA